MSVNLKEKKEDVLKMVAGVYKRRGRPCETTGWSPNEIHLFMKHQFHLLEAGKLSRRKIGGLGWELPKKKSNGRPAPLPDDVVEWSQKLQKDRLETERTRRAEQDSEEDAASSESMHAYSVAARLLRGGRGFIS